MQLGAVVAEACDCGAHGLAFEVIESEYVLVPAHAGYEGRKFGHGSVGGCYRNLYLVVFRVGGDDVVGVEVDSWSGHVGDVDKAEVDSCGATDAAGKEYHAVVAVGGADVLKVYPRLPVVVAQIGDRH